MNAQANVFDYLNEYFQFVWEHDENEKRETDLNDYLEEDFKFSAGNNWESGFDFVDWLLGQGDMGEHYKATAKMPCLHALLTFRETCSITSRIIKYYEDNYDDATSFTKEITCESVLRHLAYVELAEMSVEDLKELLGIEEEEEEESDDEDDEGEYTCAECGCEGMYDPEDICSDCIIRPYKQKNLCEETFAPKSPAELGELMRIAQESRFIDIKPYSHNIVGLTLRILSESHKYDEEKIKLVVKTFGLDKKGWGYLVGDEDEDEDN